MTTIAQGLTALRFQLGEPTQAAWDNVELRGYLYDACKDVARRTFCIRDATPTITVTGGINEYALNSNTLKIESVDWTPTGDTRRIPLSPRSYGAAAQTWGVDQNIHRSDPEIYTTLGTPPLLKLKVYPTPHTGGTFLLNVARLPAVIDITGAGDGATIELPTGWDEVAYDYALYKAFRKDRQFDIANEHNASYEQRVGDMIDLVDNYTDANDEILFDRGRGVPWYLEW